MKKPFLMLSIVTGLAACFPAGYSRVDMVYAEPAEYIYVVPVDRVVVVSREVLVNRGWVVYRVQRSGPNRVIWARRGDGEIVRIFATPSGNRVAVRGLVEVREKHHGKHAKWERRGRPRDIIAAIDVRLRQR